MKIRYINPSPKAGQISHERPDTARTLIAAGFAEAVPLPERGSAGWVQARLEQGRAQQGPPNAHDTVVTSHAPVWSVAEEYQGIPIGGVVMLRSTGDSKETFIDIIQAGHRGCPENIQKQFTERLLAPKGINVQKLDEAINAQNEYNAAHGIKLVHRHY